VVIALCNRSGTLWNMLCPIGGAEGQKIGGPTLLYLVRRKVETKPGAASYA
jgi:hypothetical protein